MTATDEIDEVVQTLARVSQLRLLPPNRVGDVAGELGDLVGHATQRVADRARLEETIPKRAKEDPLGLRAGEHEPIVARTTLGRGAAVVTGTATAHQGEPQLTAGAAEQAVQQVRRIHLGARSLFLGKPATVAAGPDAADLLPARLDGIPEILRDDPEALVAMNDVFLLRLTELAAATRPRIPGGAIAVPRPDADVLAILEDAGKGGHGPAASGRNGVGHALGVEPGGQRSDGDAGRELLEDAPNDGRLGRLDVHLVALRPRAAALVDAHFTVRLRAIPVRPLADEEAALLLAELTAERLLPKVGKLQLVEHAAQLNREGRLLVRGVEMIGDGDHADAVKLQLAEHDEHVGRVAREPRQVVDEENIEERRLGGGEERQQAGTVEGRPGAGVVGVDVGLEHDEALGLRVATTGEDLVLDALLALVLAAVSSVDGGAHQSSSQRLVRPSVVPETPG